MITSGKFSLKNKVAIVLRVEEQYGKAIASAFSEAGALLPKKDNSSNPRDAVLNAISEYGNLDILVTTPVYGKSEPAESISTDQFKKNVDLNLGQIFFWCQAAAEQMSIQKPTGGTIINVSSVSGVVGLPGQAAFCSSMAGVNAITKTLATEWQECGIRVIGLGAGFGKDFSELTTLEILLPDGRLGHRRLRENVLINTNELAQIAIFLASDAAKIINGTTVYADAGWLADGYWE
jgi:2-deoxy-D-gluconate 3-dehydrogenase|tara:strand:- start:3258 stop:3962 length:705 start_codon:yes stop_codon:yes gene_type:complete